MSNRICKNCGADENIHQYETMRCPWGGYEAPIGQKERWSTQTFEEDKSDGLAALRSELATVTAELQETSDKLHQMTHNCVGAEMELEQVTAEREAMREIIEQLEWIADEYGIECRVCGKRKPHHGSSCELAAALKGGKG